MTLEQRAALEIVRAVGEAIKELGEVPSGVLYAHLMRIMSLTAYQMVIETLCRSGLVSVSNNVIKWEG